MWLLFIAFAATVNGQLNVIGDTTHLDLAMTGFDPFCVNSFIQPDPGRRSMLLQPLQTPISTIDDEITVNQFIHDEEAAKCFPDLLVQTVTNYIEFLKYATSSTYDVSYGSPFLRYDNSASCGTRNINKDHDMLQFFNATGGEVMFVSAQCVTRTVTIAPFEPLTFTSAFETVLSNLYNAALNPFSKISDRTFSEVVESYGTHFSKKTHLGAKTIFGKLFSSRSATLGEEATRSRCVLEASKEVLTPCMRWCQESTLTRFERASSERCGETEHGVLVAIIGPLPKGSLENWASEAEELPDPIFHYLEPLSTLFEREWKTSHPVTLQINKTTLRSYFEYKLRYYTNRMLTGGFGQLQLKGCGLNSRCKPGIECLNEPDTWSGYSCVPKDASHEKPSTLTPTTPATTTAASLHTGRIIIVGGRIEGETPSTPYSLSLFGPSPPLFPVLVHGNSLSMVKDTVYSCGGYGSSNSDKKCWAIDIGNEGTVWSSFDIPWVLGYHSSVVVQDEIWFFLDSKLRILDTRNPDNKFREISLGFSFGQSTCAVAHDAQTFVIGVGVGKTEVYVNSDSSKPEQWKKFSTLLQGRQTFGCHVFRGDIFITGGYDEVTYTHLSSVEAIRVADGTVRSIGPLGGVRADHKMAIIHGRPAVLGGNNGVAGMETIETYDEQNNSWETLGDSLNGPRYHFGLTQYLP